MLLAVLSLTWTTISKRRASQMKWTNLKAQRPKLDVLDDVFKCTARTWHTARVVDPGHPASRDLKDKIIMQTRI